MADVAVGLQLSKVFTVLSLNWVRSEDWTKVRHSAFTHFFSIHLNLVRVSDAHRAVNAHNVGHVEVSVNSSGVVGALGRKLIHGSFRDLGHISVTDIEFDLHVLLLGDHGTTAVFVNIVCLSQHILFPYQISYKTATPTQLNMVLNNS